MSESGPDRQSGDPRETGRPVAKEMDDLYKASEGPFKLLFNNDLESDAVFLVGKEDSTAVRIPVHKFVLRMACPSFNASFSGNWKDEKVIRIIDCDSMAVLSVLRWIYCNELVFMNEQLVPALLAAKKYFVYSFISAATERTSHIWSILTFADIVSDSILKGKCIIHIITNGDACFKSDDFMQAKASSIHHVLSLPLMKIKEIVLFERCLQWSEKHCEAEGVEITPANQRKQMDDFIKLIAFPSMDAATFAGTPCTSSVLTAEEQILIFRSIAGKGVETCFRKEARNKQLQQLQSTPKKRTITAIHSPFRSPRVLIPRRDLQL